MRSVATSIGRVEYIATRSRQPMGNQTLVNAAVRIRPDPLQTAAVLKELNMTEAQFVAASRDMMNQYAPMIPRPPPVRTSTDRPLAVGSTVSA